ncbi:Nucleoid associated protein NdpA OS=Ureibacillus acetophenoni OX=614649 GN=SAMN05877842_106118 PE=4 SV=1 [Ureibacillus acetophenoni]
MLDVSESKLLKYVDALCGDKLVPNDEVYAQQKKLLQAAFTQLAFHKIDWDQQYEFFHETDLGLNEVYTYVNSIFYQEESFLEQSKNIATHLNSSSAHPAIKNGELFIGLFDNCILTTGATKEGFGYRKN